MPARSFAMCLLMILVTARGAAAADEINPELGDASWVAARGRVPTDGDDERARIATHLTYVLGELRAAPVAPEVQPRRTQALDALARYIARGEFPRRTGDAFAGRRPRFIDDRGVHCAVGQLIADTGSPALARAINLEHEYAYVRDITTPGLAEWARATGFTVDELAMIQPAYSAPPTVVSTRRALDDSAAQITVSCAREHRPLEELRLHVAGTGRIDVTTESTDPFARCFVEHAVKLVQRGGAWKRGPEPVDYSLTLKLPDPEKLFAAALAQVVPAPSCWPRPGALARSATLEVRMNNGLLVMVTTLPRNDEVARCLQDDIASKLKHYVSTVWTHRSQRDLRLAPHMEEQELRERITAYLPRVVLSCYAQDERPTELRVSVSARIDDPELAIAFPGVQERTAACLREALGKIFVETAPAFRMVDGKRVPYPRIDADVATTVTVKVSH